MTPASPNRMLADLADAFDRRFASPLETHETLTLLVAFQREAFAYAFRLTEVQGLLRCPPIVPLPAGPPSLLGLVGVRGRVVALHDLDVILGHSQGRTPEWVLLAGRHEPFGLGFSGFEECIGVPEAAIRPTTEHSLCCAHVGEGQAIRRVIDLAAIVNWIEDRTEWTGGLKE